MKMKHEIARINAQTELLKELREYLVPRMDADTHPDGRVVPNEEMKLVAAIDEATGKYE